MTAVSRIGHRPPDARRADDTAEHPAREAPEVAGAIGEHDRLVGRHDRQPDPARDDLGSEAEGTVETGVEAVPVDGADEAPAHAAGAHIPRPPTRARRS